MAGNTEYIVACKTEYQVAGNTEYIVAVTKEYLVAGTIENVQKQDLTHQVRGKLQCTRCQADLEPPSKIYQCQVGHTVI